MPVALPIDAVLNDVSDAYAMGGRLILAAPPGAGKTTRVPLHLLSSGALNDGKLLLLEPRRLAARGAARRMASELGEQVGQTIGLSTRLERKTSAATRIEVITDGLFVRRLLADPELSGVACVVFDEVHERSLNVDLGLALAMEAQEALREDLRLILMSATLDTQKIRARIGGQTIESAGRAYPVETLYAGRPAHHVEPHVARIIHRALGATPGSILVFLPGAREIRRVQEALQTDGVPANVDVFPLYGALPPADQDKAVQPPEPGRRKIVLSTDIAESAITIEGVSTVVDCGLVRVPVYEPSGRTQRLVTERASLASVDQRRGRAGRTGPGVCFRLWDAAETRGLTPEISPEILRADLAGLALSLAEWGVQDGATLTWLDPPPPGRLRAGRARLEALGALDSGGGLTRRGREMIRLPLPPHLAALIAGAETPGERALGAEIAALLSERGLGGPSIDLGERLSRFRRKTSPRARAMQRQAARWGGGAKPQGDPALCLARVWPDAIARRRKDGGGQHLTAGGEAVHLPPETSLSQAEWLVVADAMGGAKGARASLVAPVAEADILALVPPTAEETARFESGTGKFSARRVQRIGAIIVSEHPLPRPSGAAARQALLDVLGKEGWAALGAHETVAILLARLAFARAGGAELPQWSEAGLAATAGDWLLPEPGGPAGVPRSDDIRTALLRHLGWEAGEALKSAAPEALALPSGRSAPIDYLDEKAPLVTARVQELYGLTAHPVLGRSHVPVTLSLTSPAGRQIALTADLPGFWSGGYHDMAKDMRARYPKHDWPEDPATARPHEGRTKARLAR